MRSPRKSEWGVRGVEPEIVGAKPCNGDEARFVHGSDGIAGRPGHNCCVFCGLGQVMTLWYSIGYIWWFFNILFGYVYGNYFERVKSDSFEHSWVGLSQRFDGSGQVQKSDPWTTLGEALEKRMVRSIGSGIWGSRVQDWGPSSVMRLREPRKNGEGFGKLIDWLRRCEEGSRDMFDWGDWDVLRKYIDWEA